MDEVSDPIFVKVKQLRKELNVTEAESYTTISYRKGKSPNWHVTVKRISDAAKRSCFVEDV